MWNKYNCEVFMTPENNNKEMEQKGLSKLIWLKEGVAATLGILIVSATIILLVPSLTAVPADATSAQAIFAVLGGWGGVVIGYYFGRIPAEKAADKAEKVADSARTERDKAEKDRVNEIVTSNEERSEYEKQIKELLEALEEAGKIIKKKAEK
jgi:hypothetical protein